MNIIFSPSPNLNDRSADIDAIIIHYTDMPSADAALAWMRNPESQVSAHYLIDEKGAIHQLVPDEKRAWHAGVSYWQGDTNLNDRSIGIELANPGHTHGYVPFPEPQIESLLSLCQKLRVNWDIPSARIIGHSDIAPQRKQDPGHLFPWEILAREGLGLCPKDDGSVIQHEGAIEALGKIGYDTTSPQDTVAAFQRHFRPLKIDGMVDEETLRLIGGLV